MDLKRALLAAYTLVVGAALLFAPSLPGTMFGVALLGLAAVALFVSGDRIDGWLRTSRPR
jgi:hypothetical protein